MPQTTEEKKSVQTFPDAKEQGGLGGASPIETMLLSFYTQLNQAPAYWSRARDAWLREFVTNPGNDLLAGTMATVAAKVATTGWVLEGPERTANKYRRILVQLSDFGAGWSGYIQRWVWDYLSQDAGGWSERIRIGKRGTGASIGFANLDNARIRITGDPMWPIRFTPVSFDGKSADEVLMHYSQVMHLVDSPTPNALRRGVGFCAVSRALMTAQILLDITTYERERLSDLPPAGLLMINNLTAKQWEDVSKRYDMKQQQEGNRIWRQIMVLFGIDPAVPLQVELLSFSQLPDNFDKKTATEIAVYSFALAFRIDPREIWPVSAGPMGTATEANIQHIKAKAKGPGLIMTDIERLFNQELSLPPTLTFRFDFQDAEEDLQSAEIADVKAQFLRRLTEPIGQDEEGILSREEARQWLVTEGLFDEEALMTFTPDESASDTAEAKSAWAIDMGPRTRVYSDGRTVRLEKRPQAWGGYRPKGGPGSGHFGHAGRPGEVGGSLPEGAGGGGVPSEWRAGVAPGEPSPDVEMKAKHFLVDGLNNYYGKQISVDAKGDDYARTQAKDELITALAERTGLSYETVNTIIEQWAETAGDNDLPALGLQAQAGETFGVEIRQSLLERINTIKAERGLGTGKFDPETSWPELGTYEEQGVISVSQQRVFYQAMYEYTQERLISAGFELGDSIQLYRGVTFDAENVPDWKPGQTIEIAGNPLQSWSLERSKAMGFASREGDAGAILFMEVPIESIVSTPRTGVGCLPESEFVIMGGNIGHQAVVNWMR